MEHAYRCGLKPGTKVRLKRHLEIVRAKTKRAVSTDLAGQVWTVLKPRPDDPVVFFRRADGGMHTWDDSIESIKEYFDILDG